MAETSTGTGSAGLLAGAAGSWKLDPATTTVEFHTKAMWGLAKVKGTMTAIEGSGTVRADGVVAGTFVIDVTSISTKNKKRDEHLRGADFFEVEKYPRLTYSVSGITPMDDGKLKVSGSLEVHGRTSPLEFFATATQDSSGRVTLTLQAEIDRSQWGMSWAKMGAKLDNQVVVKADFVKV